MNSKYRLPKIDILFQFISAARYVVFPLLLGVIQMSKKDIPWWGITALIGGISLLLLIISFFMWRSFHYVFMEDKIVIYSGVFTKKEKTIYFQRIHSVNISQNLFHRLLKLANLSIETPGLTMGKSDGEIRCLSIDKAKQLQALLQRMGEATRNEEQGTQEQLFQSIIMNMDNSNAANNGAGEAVIDTEVFEHSANERNVKGASIQPSKTIKMDSELMLKSALTSLNINIVLVWFAGIYAFADDVIALIFPDSEFFETLFDGINFKEHIWMIIIIVFAIAIFFTWLLSILFYIIKFYDYKLEKQGQQINVSYGLFNRQSYVFNETKVQSIVFEENILRQIKGYGELKVNIVKSMQEGNQMDSSYIVIHPFTHKHDIAGYIQELMPRRSIMEHSDEQVLPKESLRSYTLIPSIFSFIPCFASIYYIQWNALWLLLLPVVVVIWGWIKFKSARISIDGHELKMVTRQFSKYSVYVKRHNVVTLIDKASPYQHRKGLRKITLKTLGGMMAKSYSIQGVTLEKVGEAKAWLNSYLKEIK